MTAGPLSPPPGFARRGVLASLGIAAGTALAGTGCAEGTVPGGSTASELAVVRRTGAAFGTTVSMVGMHPDARVVNRAFAVAFDALETVERVMSLYRPDSELARLNREGMLSRPHPYLVSVLWAAQDMARRTAGAFDATVQPLWEVYAAAMAAGRLPHPDAVEAARRRVDWRHVEATPSLVRLAAPGTAVTLNGIAQGFATDRVLAVLRRFGIRHALVNTGEVGSLGGKRAEPWSVGIQHPRQEQATLAAVLLRGGCLATSGDYATPFTADYAANHLFDPATGRSPHTLSSVTVLAPTAMEADALSTASFVLGVERARRLFATTAGAEALFVRKDGEVVTTPGLLLDRGSG